MPRSMLAFLFLILAAMPPAASAQGQPQPTYLYKTSLVQAAPGKLLDLIDAYKKIFTEEAKVTGDATPLWMRHSQGDRWDLLILVPDGQLHGLLQAGPRRETRYRHRHLARTPENRHRLARRHLRLRPAARRSAQSIRNCRPLSRGDVSVPARQASRAAETTRNGKRLLPHRESSREFHFS